MENKIKIILFVSMVLIFSIIIPGYLTYENNKETQYCGNVVDVYMTQSHYGVTRHVVFYCDSLKRNIDVRVTNQQYVNTKIGQKICFDLNKNQLEE